jgi:hypothetical protein
MTLSRRLRRAITPPVTTPGRAPSPDPAPRAAAQDPAAPGPRPPGGSVHPADPPGASPPPRPKRRRWLPPTTPAERQAEPVDQPTARLYPCPHCGAVHQPVPIGGGGLADIAGRSLLPDPTRPEPLGRQAGDTSSLVRDSFSPWRAHPAELPPSQAAGTMRDRLVRLWAGDE